MAFDVAAGGKRGVQPTMNVTPLVDVVLVLLIIFMVVTPMMTKQLEVHLPPDDQDAPAPPPASDAIPPLVLTLAKDGQPRVNGEVIARPELSDRLQRMLNARADKVVFFDAGDGVPYGEALALMDLVKGGGIETVAVLADNVTDSKAAPTP